VSEVISLRICVETKGANRGELCAGSSSKNNKTAHKNIHETKKKKK